MGGMMSSHGGAQPPGEQEMKPCVFGRNEDGSCKDDPQQTGGRRRRRKKIA